MKTPERNLLKSAAGYTLVEIAIAGSLLTLVLSSVAMLGLASERAYYTSATASQLEAQTAVTMDRIVAELSIAGIATVDPDPLPGLGSDEVTYLQATGITDGEVEWTSLRRLAFEYEVGEVDDGLDNNGNGLIDEGHVVLTEDFGGPNEHTRVLTRWVREHLEGEEENGIDDNGNDLVDEPGFLVERIGETLVIRLTLERMSKEGLALTRTAETSTRLRN